MDSVKLGNTHFNFHSLRTVELEEALKMFSKAQKSDVEKAWKMANPEKAKSKKRATSKNKEEEGN